MAPTSLKKVPSIVSINNMNSLICNPYYSPEKGDLFEVSIHNPSSGSSTRGFGIVSEINNGGIKLELDNSENNCNLFYHLSEARKQDLSHLGHSSKPGNLVKALNLILIGEAYNPLISHHFDSDSMEGYSKGYLLETFPKGSHPLTLPNKFPGSLRDYFVMQKIFSYHGAPSVILQKKPKLL